MGKVESWKGVGINNPAPEADLEVCINGATDRLNIAGGVLRIQTGRAIPNLWHRFWQRVLLGWRWEKVSENE